jgi:hypothetical protein
LYGSETWILRKVYQTYLERYEMWFWRRMEISWFLISNFRRVLHIYVYLWVIPRRLNFIYRRFGTLCIFHLNRQVGVYTYLPMKLEHKSFSKRRYIKFRHQGITQRKTYISWFDRVEDGVLYRSQEERNVLYNITRKKVNWICHILRRNCLIELLLKER